MEIFSALLALCSGNSPVTGEFPSQRPVTRSFDGFFELRLNKPLSKQSSGWWFETPSGSLWRHCNDLIVYWTCNTASDPNICSVIDLPSQNRSDILGIRCDLCLLRPEQDAKQHRSDKTNNLYLFGTMFNSFNWHHVGIMPSQINERSTVFSTACLD